MTRLSIIFVNYNVKHFLEQALHSVRKAIRDLSAEIFVVDNNSVDGSDEMIRQKFPEVNLIVNKENKGFAAANNQAIRASSSEYVLLLNPDTVVEEDTFQKVVQFMDEHPEAGGLGVKMIDGKGNFLPESKRGFPSPSVAFFKIFGLTWLFPKSRIFGKYHLGYLDANKVHEVDVLSGAFMLIRKKVLDEVGLLDEDYFMYGEDIDLSYRIIKAGYRNYYYPETRIIHYKGESTKKGGLNYVRLFYNAMIIFARKHLSKGQADLFSALIRTAIYFRAIISMISRFVHRFSLPAVDVIVLFLGMFFLKEFWEHNVKAAEGLHYPDEYMYINIPLYIFIWIISVFFSGGYDNPLRTRRIVRGLLIGTIIIAAVYGFLEEEYRFSRAMILFGAAWALIAMVGLRALIHMIKHKNLQFDEVKDKKVIIAGEQSEAKRVLSLLNQIGANVNFIGFVTPRASDNKESQVIGDMSQLQDLVSIYRVDEIIFCSKDITSQQIIKWMTLIGNGLDYKIVPQESLSIIGSNSKDTAGDLYAVDINLAIASSIGKRNKRVLDLLVSFFLTLTFPIHILMVKNPMGMIKNIFRVIIGNKSWVGYGFLTGESGPKIVDAGFTGADSGSVELAPGPELQSASANYSKLPMIKPGVLSQFDTLKKNHINEITADKLNLLYAKDYSIWQDINIIWKGYRMLGRRQIAN